MYYKGLIKRLVPFFVTFAAGLFIASFFVTIATPSFNFRRGPGRFGEMQRLRSENQELKRTNGELRRQVEELRINTVSAENFTLDGFPLETDAPPPPRGRATGYGNGSGR